MVPLGGPMGRHSVRVVTVLAILAAACTGGGTPKPTPSTTPRRGGDATFGAEQWPECVNPINQCSASAWTWYTVLEHVLPRAMQLDPKGNFVASPLLREGPSLQNGLLTANPFTIRYKISDKAVWADGSPITSADFDFTWKAILNTTGAHTTVGYTSINSIDTSDLKTAVIMFQETFVAWPDLFGGVYQGILEKAAFPKFAEEPKPNLKYLMEDSIPFSGGPFLLESWSKDHAVLSRNDRYFGPTVLLDRVTLVPLTDARLELRSLAQGDVDVIAPNADHLAACCTGNPLDATGLEVRGEDGTSVEVLWFNAHERPLNNPLVREALMYAVDRQRVVDAVVKPLNPSAEVLNCGFLALPKSPWCRTRPFQRFTYDPVRAVRLLEQAGYDCTRFPCTKKGRPLEVRYLSNSISVLATTPQQLIIQGAFAAGFRLKVINFEAGVLFGAQTTCPFPRMPITGCDVVVPPDPSVTERLGCDAIPSEENAYVGRNRIAWCNAEADRLMKQNDRELDHAKRLESLDRIYQLESEDMIGLPLFVVPAIVAWRVDRLDGPIGRYLSSPYGMFLQHERVVSGLLT